MLVYYTCIIIIIIYRYYICNNILHIIHIQKVYYITNNIYRNSQTHYTKIKSIRNYYIIRVVSIIYSHRQTTPQTQHTKQHNRTDTDNTDTDDTDTRRI